MNAQSQAIAQIESIIALVAALRVDYDRLDELRDEQRDCAADGLVFEYAEELAELESQAGDCIDLDQAQLRIQEDPLSVEVRSGWVGMGDTMDAEEFRIVLCTGGPHVEIVGDLRNGSPSSVRVLYRDWSESGELFNFDHDAVLTYCEQFCFGE